MWFLILDFIGLIQLLIQPFDVLSLLQHPRYRFQPFAPVVYVGQQRIVLELAARKGTSDCLEERHAHELLESDLHLTVAHVVLYAHELRDGDAQLGFSLRLQHKFLDDVE